MALALLLNGCAAFTPPDDAQAAGADAESLEQTPTDPQSWYRLGNDLAEGGRLREAQGAYEQALALDSEFAPARYNLGLVHVQLGWRAVIAATPDLAEPDRAALTAARYLQCVADILKGNPEPIACRSPQPREDQE